MTAFARRRWFDSRWFDSRWFDSRWFDTALLLVLAAGWVVAYSVARRDLDSSTPAGRTFLLALFNTQERIEIGLFLGLGACGLLVLRRRLPLATLAVVGSLVVAAELWFPLVTRSSFIPELTIAVAAFWAAWASKQPWPFVLALAVAGLGACTIRSYRVNPRLDAASGTSSGQLVAGGETMLAVLIAVLAVIGGLMLRRFAAQRDELGVRNSELDARNAELDQARATIAERAVMGERVRIARELHDVVAHHVTTMTVHAGAARQLARGQVPQINEALLQIETSGRGAVTELHRLLGFLRGSDHPSTDDARAPTPSLRQLDRLVSSLTGDLDIRLTIEGDPGAITPTVDLSAYRIVQEALTNTVKHAGASVAEVAVRYGPATVELVVVDNGSGLSDSIEGQSGSGQSGLGQSGLGQSGSGLGIVGMTERVALHGGTLDVGTYEQGGWRVAAVLPYDTQPTLDGAPR